MSSQRWYHSLPAPALAALSGVLLALSLPPRDMNTLGWVALMPLLAASLLVKRSLLAAGFGLVTSFVCAWVLIGHVANPEELGNMVGAFGSLGLVLAWTAGWGCFAAKRCRVSLWPLFVGCAAVTGELLGRYVFPVSVAITQYQTPGALRLASVTGMWGVSFLLWFVPALLLVYFARPREVGWRVLIAPTVVLLMLIVPFKAVPENRPKVTVAAVQAPGLWDAADVTGKLAEGVDIAVWPEYLMSEDDTLPSRTARENDLYIVSSHVEKAGPKEKYNTARLISPSGKTIDSVRKKHLFGREIYGFKAGQENHPIQCGEIKVGIPICFDTEFTDICRGLVRDGAQILLVPNSDPQTHNLLFNHLHSAVIPFRAAENGVPVVWAEPYGLSCVVDRCGSRVTQVSGHKVTAAGADLRLDSGGTMYLLLGDSFAYLCAIVTLAAIIAMLARGRSKEQELFPPRFVL